MSRRPSRSQYRTRPNLVPLEGREVPATLVWQGDVDANWGTNTAGNTNWSGNILPANGDDLTFPLVAQNRTNTNNIPNLSINLITFGGTDYVIGGNSLALLNLTDGSSAGASKLNLPLTVAADLTATVTVASTTLTLGGAITGAGGLVKNGAGKITLTGSTSNTFAGTTKVNNGFLDLFKAGGTGGLFAISGSLVIGDGSGAANTAVVTEIANQEIANVGVTINTDGTFLLPNNKSDSVGAVASVGRIELGSSTLGTANFSLGGTANTLVALNGTTAGTFSRINVAGTAQVGGALVVTSTVAAAAGTKFTILANDGTDAVTGTFSGLAEGATVTASDGSPYTISYAGGDGNDVELTLLARTRSATGATAAAIQTAVDAFRSDFGGALNPNLLGSFETGRREINWDGVPDNKSSPTNLPLDFFNTTSPRGAVFSTPGTGVLVSQDDDAPSDADADLVRFSDIQGGYSTTFGAFSAQRIFTAQGSNVVDVNFFVPGTTVPATVRGFGAVFTDVDDAASTTIEFFNPAGSSVFKQSVMATAGNASFSFAGASFDAASGIAIAKVRITAGSGPLGAGLNDVTQAGAKDVVAMDDFIYSEPQAVTPIVDFGDAPDSYGTTRTADGARHTAVGPFLGTTRNAEADGQPSAGANAATDDDGVTFGLFPAGGTVPVTFALTNPSGSNGAFVQGFIDWNQDGDFADANEIVVTNGTSFPGQANTFNVSVPSDAKVGTTVARFRVVSTSVSGTPTATGLLSNGEVEDYLVTVVPATIRTAAGANPAAIQAAVDAFRADLGALNANAVGSFAGGRREINWDGVPDGKSAPVNLPADFFNATSPRGVVFSFAAGSAGTGFQVSADAANPTGTPVEFGNLNASYPGILQTFSAERLFTTLGDRAYQIDFFVPGTSIPATVGGFGAVFVDADGSGSSIEYFDAAGLSLGRFRPQSADNGLSFLGVNFNQGERIAKVVLTAGDTAVGPNDSTADVVVFDDFIYGEPQPIANTPPTIGDVANQTSNGTAVGPLTFVVNDAETPVGNLIVTGQSNNPALIASVGIGGSGSARTVTVVPVAGQSGTATITLAVADGNGATAMDTFTVVVDPTRAPQPFVIGNGVGNTIQFRDATGAVISEFAVFPPTFTGGVRTASADFNGDGTLDFVVGTGPGAPTRVRILNGTNQTELFAIDPFEATFTGGVFVSTGDLDGDGRPDLVISPDEGGGPRVDVFGGNGFVKIDSFFGIDDPNFRGGARTSIGDVTGDGRHDLIVVAGFGGGPRVAGFDGRTIGTANRARIFGDFFAFEQTLRNGVFVAVGDLNADGFADLIAGGGPGGGPRVLAFDGKSLLDNQYVNRANFFGGDPDSRGGIRLAVKNLDGDDRADLVVGSGSGAGSRVTAYLGTNIAPVGTPPSELEFDSFAGFTGGVFVG